MGEAGYLLFMRASAAKRPNVWVSLLSADVAGRSSARSWRWRYRHEQRGQTQAFVSNGQLFRSGSEQFPSKFRQTGDYSWEDVLSADGVT